MATEFLHTSIFARSYVLTSELSSIVASTDAAKLTVSLACSGDTFFTVELYAYNGRVELLDPGSIVEGYFRSKKMVTGSVDVTFGEVTRPITFLYCEYSMPRDFNPENALLLSSSVRRVHDGSHFGFAAIPLGPYIIIDLKAFGLDKNGIPVNAELKFSVEASKVPTHTCIFGYSFVRDFMTKNPDMVKVLYFSVSSGCRQLMCYLSPATAWLTFSFRNIFNVEEYIDVEGSMTVKSETSRQSAKCSGDIVQYDRRTDRTYQFTTGPLAAEEVETYAQLVASHTVKLYLDGRSYDVVIEDHTCEVSTDDDSLAVIKFTWRFKGRRPVNFNSSIFGIQPSNRGIFSDEYSPEYE